MFAPATTRLPITFKTVNAVLEIRALKWPELGMNDLAFIALSNGGYTVIDAGDFQKLNRYSWRNHLGHAQGGWPKRDMAHLVIPVPDGKVPEHRNRFGLDNRRCNLRIATKLQNDYNRRKPVTPAPASKFKGVTWKADHKAWRAQIRINGKKKHLGYFSNELDAKVAYENAAKHHFGEFACFDSIVREIQSRTSKHIKRVNTSKFKGVYWNSTNQRWGSRFKRKYLGWFHSEMEAHEAFISEEKKHLNKLGQLAQNERK